MSQSGLSSQDFAIMAAAALVKDGVEENSLSFDPEKFVLEIKDGRGVPVNTIRLHNFYARYTATSDSEVHQRIFKQMVDLSHGLQTALSWEEAAPKLRPIARQKWWLRDDNCPAFDLGEHLRVAIGYDFDDHIAYVTNEDLTGWGVSFDDAYDTAFNNLVEITEFVFDTYASEEGSPDCCHFFSAEDSYGASRIVFTKGVESMPVLGDLLVAVPSKDHILVTGSECSYGLEETLAAIKELQEQPGALVPTLMRLEDGFFYPYELPKDHALYADFQRLKMDYVDRLYHSQKEELKSQFDGLTGNVTYLVHKVNYDKDVPVSVTFVAPEFIPCSLPKTDYVIFGTQEGPLAIATWDRVEMILEEKLLPIDSYPVRYEINEFPSEAILELLGFVNFGE